MNRDWFAVARPVPPPVPFRGVDRHLGLGADWWPPFDGDDAIAAEVDAATNWYPFETLIGREWQAVLCDRALAERYLQAARRHLPDATLLCLSSRALEDCLGWDVGPTHGGHSIAIHEIGAAAFANWAGETTAEGLFRRRADAESFLARRAQTPQPAGLEELGAWSIVCVARIDGGDLSARG